MHINTRVEELKQLWKITGCTVMLDGKDKSLLNILVNCSKGTRFIKFMDGSTYVIDATLLQVVG